MKTGTLTGLAVGTVAGMAAGVAVTMVMENTGFGRTCMKKGRKAIRAMKSVF